MTMIRSLLVTMLLVAPTVVLGAANCSSVSVSPNSLWPPNHKMVDISIKSTNSSDKIFITGITSNEAVDEQGSGNTSPDAIIAKDAKSCQVRSERAGGGNGRTYFIAFNLTTSGNETCTSNVPVCVAKSQGNSKEASVRGGNGNNGNGNAGTATCTGSGPGKFDATAGNSTRKGIFSDRPFRTALCERLEYRPAFC